MKIGVAILLIAGLPFVAQLTRETNSHAANARGVKQFAAKKFAEAEKAFATASAIASSPSRAFNLGTSEIAAGNREAGSTTIAKAHRRNNGRGGPDTHARTGFTP